MEEVKNETKQEKTQVFNVIILDKSGSMESIRKAAVDGFNETLAGIKGVSRALCGVTHLLRLREEIRVRQGASCGIPQVNLG